MFKSLLIANRGEIACRILRTAKRLGLRTISVFSEADADALHVLQADEAHLIGPARASESYLNIAHILEAAAASGADAIHPGYGFLSENAQFAQACAKAGINFVGPPVSAMRLMGRKDDAKAVMKKNGIPVVPGYQGRSVSPSALLKEAKKLGFPVMIKAVAGGGGRGLRLVEGPAAFAAALESASREAEAAFGDGAVLLEKAVINPRHIEVQVFADSHGNVVHLFERDCSLQRRHQKVIEEAPAPYLAEDLREAILKSALEATRAVDYSGAGTVEFLVEGATSKKQASYYFLEMNTRLQVEHPVTEAVTGLDLVEWQIRVAAGERLPADQSQIPCFGAAIEARIYAEDPAKDFRPSAAKIHALAWPSGDGLRIDTGVREGDSVSPHYDTMIAKLIAHGPSREQALVRLGRAVKNTLIAGPKTNLGFLSGLISSEEVDAGRYDTSLIDRRQSKLPAVTLSRAAIEAGAQALLKHQAGKRAARHTHFSQEVASPWSSGDGFALGRQQGETLRLLVDGEPTDFNVAWRDGSPQVSMSKGSGPKKGAERAAREALEKRVIATDGSAYVIENLSQAEISFFPTARGNLDVDSTGGTVRSPLPGRVARLYVKKGDRIESGDRIAVLEAMKMEHVLHAPTSGLVEEMSVAEGEQILQDVVIARIVEIEPGGDGA